MKSSRLGLIPHERLARIPTACQPQHEFCFHIHDSMLSMFFELAGSNYPSLTIDFEDPEEAERLHAASDTLRYFLENGERDFAKHMAVGQAMKAIWGDFFNFIYEGLIALEKRKFIVAFALLRKPLKENLLLLTMMLVDDDAFFNGLESAPAASFGHPGLQDTHRRAYFTKAKEIIPFAEFVDPEFLHDLIFDVGFEGGLAPSFDKATHLVTNRKQIQTEGLNLNFIFKDPSNDDLYHSVYRQLAYVLLYAMLLEIELFKRAGLESRKVSQWFSLTGMGSYIALFCKAPCPIASSMNRVLKPFLICPHCDAPVRIRKSEAARFFTVHKLSCRKCGHEHDFPLFWIMAKTEWSLSDEDGDPIVSEVVVHNTK